jgi:hypothetical protein
MTSLEALRAERLERREELRACLWPAGTPLKDALPHVRGLLWRAYEELLLLEALCDLKVDEVPYVSTLPISTSRDNYGWKSLPAGIHSLPFSEP